MLRVIDPAARFDDHRPHLGRTGAQLDVSVFRSGNSGAEGDDTSISRLPGKPALAAAEPRPVRQPGDR